MSIEERARQVLATTLGVEIAEGSELRREEEPKWDSLKHVAVIFALEDEFDVQLDEEQMASLNSLSSIIEAVRAS